MKTRVTGRGPLKSHFSLHQQNRKVKGGRGKDCVLEAVVRTVLGGLEESEPSWPGGLILHDFRWF